MQKCRLSFDYYSCCGARILVNCIDEREFWFILVVYSLQIIELTWIIQLTNSFIYMNEIEGNTTWKIIPICLHFLFRFLLFDIYCMKTVPTYLFLENNKMIIIVVYLFNLFSLCGYSILVCRYLLYIVVLYPYFSNSVYIVNVIKKMNIVANMISQVGIQDIHRWILTYNHIYLIALYLT